MRTPQPPHKYNTLIQHSVHFPGALNSKFTDELKFSNPAQETAMPTYRVLDSDGNLADPSRPAPDIPDAELLKMYRDMLTSETFDCQISIPYLH